jgi:hypothetical protein
MQAMNGSRGISVPRISRLLGCAVALLALAVMAIPSAASAMTKPPKVVGTYVSLGDSLAFGFSEHEFNESLPTENPANFEGGFPNEYLGLINENTSRLTQLVNYGCPGETTESLIGDNAKTLAAINKGVSGKVAEPVTGEAACAYHYADGFPLHTEYGAGQSQLEAAISTIDKDKSGGKKVRVISLDIGANDELHEVARATKEAEAGIEAKVVALATAEAEAEIKAKVTKIVAAEIEGYVIEQVEGQAFVESNEGEEPAFREDIGKDAAEYVTNNPEVIKSLEIRDAGHYLEEHGTELHEEGERLGEEIGEAYAAENAAKLHEEGEALGLQIIKEALPAEFEQIDTNIIGIGTALREAKKLHLGTTNYKGKIIFEAAYDPYGRVGGINKAHDELEPGFNAAAADLAAVETSTITAGSKVHACYSDAELVFNPALGIPDKESYDAEELALIGQEEVNLDEWTNMANFTEFEYEPGKFLKYGETVKVGPHGELSLDAEGPDIHATAAGYKEMAKQMKSTCGS